MPKKYNTYNKELKLRAIDMYINEGMSALSVARALNIKNKTQVQRWVELFNSKGKFAFDEETRGRAKGPHKGRPKTKFNSVEEELDYLRMENEFLKKDICPIGEEKISFIFKIIKSLSNKYKISNLCKLTGVSRSGYYK